ncbi:MAG: hypothetical protein ABIH18_06675, partial [Candidatus Omnitrophota bacterium]
MTAINVAILHGIGKNEIGYADDLENGIRKEFNAYLKKTTGLSDENTVKLVFRPIVWDDILGSSEGELKVVLERLLKQRKQKTFAGSLTGVGMLVTVCIILLFIIFKFSVIILTAIVIPVCILYHFGAKFYYQLRTSFASEFVMDIIGYLNKDVKEMIQNRIKDELKYINCDKEPV